MHPLRRLRLRLTAWYIGMSVVILLASCAVLFVSLVRATSREMDRSLQAIVHEVTRAAAIRLGGGEAPRAAVLAAADELESAARPVYLFDASGRLLFPAGEAPAALREVAAAALARGAAASEFPGAPGQRWRAYGRRMEVTGGGAYAVVALADVAEVEASYERLLESFLLSALLALLLVAAGGYYLAAVSAAPVERMMTQMRRFMADAAHELRTPISVVRSRAELALDRPREPGAYTAALEEIARETERMGTVVDDLLTLARADAGERAPRLEPVYLDDLVSDAVAAAGPLAARGGVRLELEGYEEAPATGDPALLRQLLMILLDNAIKYTPPGGRVAVSVAGEPDGARVVVRDTGVGIPPEHLPHVFERFYRADRSRADGAGLGLSIARWIVEAHGGRIALHPEPERGTRVEVRIPGALSSS